MSKMDLLKLKAEIVADYEREMAAVGTLLGRCDQSREIRSQTIAKAISAIPRSSFQCAEDIIKGMQTNFNVTTIVLKMDEQLGGRSSHRGDIARQAIHLLRQRHEVETIVPGKGRRSGVYHTIKK